MGELSLTLSVNDSVGALTVLRDVSDGDGDEVTDCAVECELAITSTLFATLPTLSTSRFVGSGTPTDIVLSGGVLNTDASGDWTATLVVGDGVVLSSTQAGVVRIEVEAAPVNNLPSYVLGELSLTLAEDSSPVSALTVLRNVFDVDSDVTVSLIVARSTPERLFSRLPTLNPPTIATGSTAVAVLLSGGVLQPDANGEWTARVELSDGADLLGGAITRTLTVGVVTLRVTPVNDAPRYTVGRSAVADGS